MILSFADASRRLGLPVDDAFELQRILTRAEGRVIQVLQWDPAQQARVETYSGSCSNTLVPNSQNVTAVASINLLQGYSSFLPSTGAALSNVTWDKIAIYLRQGVFPKGIKNVTISYTSGYGPTSNEIALLAGAVLDTVKALWTAKDVDQNVSSQSMSGVISQNFWQTGPGAIPPSAMADLNPFILRTLTA